MFSATDKISEIVNDLDSDCSSFSEISDSDMCMVEYILTTGSKKRLFDSHTHERVTQNISAGLLEFGVIIHTPYAVSVQMSRDKFLALLTIL
jgi:citrate lyase alpha subunit